MLTPPPKLQRGHNSGDLAGAWAATINYSLVEALTDRSYICVCCVICFRLLCNVSGFPCRNVVLDGDRGMSLGAELHGGHWAVCDQGRRRAT